MSHRSAVPTYRKHEQSGQAVVTFRLPNGRRKDYLLGRHGSKESKTEYARLLAEFQAGHGAMPGTSGVLGDLTVNELLVQYLRHCDQFYRNADGTPTGHADGVRFALRVLMSMYGHTMARDFGPLALKAVRTALVERGNCRKTVNVRVGLIRQFFKWCVAEELLPSSVYEGLRAVAGLQPGRTAALDRKPVKPVDPSVVNAALPFMPPPVAALVQLQLLSGARGGELFTIRSVDIDRSGLVWVYRPPQHKNAWRTRDREIFLGQRPNFSCDLGWSGLTMHLSFHLRSPRLNGMRCDPTGGRLRGGRATGATTPRDGRGGVRGQLSRTIPQRPTGELSNGLASEHSRFRNISGPIVSSGSTVERVEKLQPNGSYDWVLAAWPKCARGEKPTPGRRTNFGTQRELPSEGSTGSSWPSGPAGRSRGAGRQHRPRAEQPARNRQPPHRGVARQDSPRRPPPQATGGDRR